MVLAVATRRTASAQEAEEGLRHALHFLAERQVLSGISCADNAAGSENVNITRKSMFTGVVRTLDLPVTEDQMRAYENGMFVQDAFPSLCPADREFIKTGVTQEEWDEAFGDEEDHCYDEVNLDEAEEE